MRCKTLYKFMILLILLVGATSVYALQRVFIDDDNDGICGKYSSGHNSFDEECPRQREMPGGEDSWDLDCDDEDPACWINCGTGILPGLNCLMDDNLLWCTSHSECTAVYTGFSTKCNGGLCEFQCDTDDSCTALPECASGNCVCLDSLDSPGDTDCYAETFDYDGDFVSMLYDCEMFTKVCGVLNTSDTCVNSDQGSEGYKDSDAMDCWDWCIDNDGDGECAETSVRYDDWDNLPNWDVYKLSLEAVEGQLGLSGSWTMADLENAAPFDCNDGDAEVNSTSVETCNGKDDDCNGLIDECLNVDGSVQEDYFCADDAGGGCVNFDEDGDDHLKPPRGDDCDDTPAVDPSDPQPDEGPLRYKGAPEFPLGVDIDGFYISDGYDNNCNGVADEGLDNDRDGVSNEDEDDGCVLESAPAGDTSAINPATGCVYVLVGWG